MFCNDDINYVFVVMHVVVLIIVIDYLIHLNDVFCNVLMMMDLMMLLVLLILLNFHDYLSLQDHEVLLIFRNLKIIMHLNLFDSFSSLEYHSVIWQNWEYKQTGNFNTLEKNSGCGSIRMRTPRYSGTCKKSIDKKKIFFLLFALSFMSFAVIEKEKIFVLVYVLN